MQHLTMVKRTTRQGNTVGTVFTLQAQHNWPFWKSRPGKLSTCPNKHPEKLIKLPNDSTLNSEIIL